jgi:hypothetical protein
LNGPSDSAHFHPRILPAQPHELWLLIQRFIDLFIDR